MNFLLLLVIGGITVWAKVNGRWVQMHEEAGKLQNGQTPDDKDVALIRRIRFANLTFGDSSNITANDTAALGPQGPPFNATDESNATTVGDGRQRPNDPPSTKWRLAKKPDGSPTPKSASVPQNVQSSAGAGNKKTGMYIIVGIVSLVVGMFGIGLIAWLIKRHKEKALEIENAEGKVAEQEKNDGNEIQKTFDSGSFLLKSTKEPEKAENQFERSAKEASKSKTISVPLAPVPSPIIKVDKKSVAEKPSADDESSSSSRSSSSEEEETQSGDKSGAKSGTKSSASSGAKSSAQSGTSSSAAAASVSSGHGVKKSAAV